MAQGAHAVASMRALDMERVMIEAIPFLSTLEIEAERHLRVSFEPDHQAFFHFGLPLIRTPPWGLHW